MWTRRVLDAQSDAAQEPEDNSIPSLVRS
jgi:hypothetical protein